MTEEDAREHARLLAPDAIDKLHRYAELLVAENARQNLIARSTETALWVRHFLDAIQLTKLARAEDRTWLDIGTGPGLPGIVLAIAGPWQMALVEPRRRRVEFLHEVIDQLELDNVRVLATTGEKVVGRYDLVTARAVASVEALFAMTRSCAVETTRFILPRGRGAWTDVDAANQRWHGLFHVEHSLTDPTAGIVVADRVSHR